jgi:hypothetical protein
MFWVTLGFIGVAGVLLIYKTIRPMTRRRRKFDAGAVSEDWIQQHRGHSRDASR